MEICLRENGLTLGKCTAKLEALNPLAVLARGYAAVSNVEGQAVLRAKELREHEPITIRFSDGLVSAEVTSVKGLNHDKESNEL